MLVRLPCAERGHSCAIEQRSSSFVVLDGHNRLVCIVASYGHGDTVRLDFAFRLSRGCSGGKAHPDRLVGDLAAPTCSLLKLPRSVLSTLMAVFMQCH